MLWVYKHLQECQCMLQTVSMTHLQAHPVGGQHGIWEGDNMLM